MKARSGFIEKGRDVRGEDSRWTRHRNDPDQALWQIDDTVTF